MLVLQVILIWLYLDVPRALANPPLADTDYATHWAETWSMAHFLDHGRLWGYDPYFMAGYPGNALFDVDNKLVALVSWLLSQTGLSLELSYTLTMTILLLSAPLAIYPAARWFGLGADSAVVAQLAALALWYCDPALRWAWQGGTLAFVSATAFGLLVLAAGSRLMESGARPAVWPLVVWLAGGPLLFWLHAFSFFVLLVPLSTLVLVSWGRASRFQRLLLVAWPPLVVVANLPWLIPFVRFLPLRMASDQFLQGGLPALLYDLIGRGSGDVRASVAYLGLRWLLLFGGLLGLALLVWRQRSWAPVLAGVVTALALAYGAAHLPGGGDFQPYRYVLQAVLWATLGLPAALTLARRALIARSRALGVAARAAAVLAALWLAFGLWHVRPELLADAGTRAWHGPSDDVQAVCDYLRAEHDGSRVLTDDWRIAALLPACAGVEVIGGPFIHVPIEHGYANSTPWSFLRGAYREHRSEPLRLELAAYNVGWFVAYNAFPEGWYTLNDRLRDEPGLAAPLATFGSFAMYRSDTEPTPDRVSATFDRLEVRDLPAGEPVTLPYHWLDGLTSPTPGVTLAPVQVYNDPVPFIQITRAHGGDALVCLRARCAR